MILPDNYNDWTSLATSRYERRRGRSPLIDQQTRGTTAHHPHPRPDCWLVDIDPVSTL
ncbi:MAG: hypothetical protein P8183_03825 [Anaerolineae bacterium]